MMNWFQQEVEQGRKQGELGGRRAQLLKMLRLRFGELPAVAVARVEVADVPQLDLWAERFVTALEDVIGPA